jgi:hypothetical protein
MNLKFILLLFAVQLLVSCLPNKAVAAEVGVDDYVQDAKSTLILAAAYNAEYAPYFNRALRALEQIKKVVRMSEGQDFEHCKKYNVYGYWVFYDKKIYLCDRVMKLGRDRIVQTIIHEATHVAGYRSECDATRLAFYAMMINGRPASKVGYTCPDVGFNSLPAKAPSVFANDGYFRQTARRPAGLLARPLKRPVLFPE